MATERGGKGPMTSRRRIEQLERLQRQQSHCPDPPIEFREGTLEELEAMPELPRECPLCGRVHGGIRFIEVVADHNETEA